MVLFNRLAVEEAQTNQEHLKNISKQHEDELKNVHQRHQDELETLKRQHDLKVSRHNIERFIWVGNIMIWILVSAARKSSSY